MKLTVKRWIADKKGAEMKIDNYFADVEYINGYYADVENDTVTYVNVSILKETEKAVLAKLSCGNVGKIGTYNVWFPKSQVVAIA